MVRGVRGATTIKANDQHEVIQATRELLTEMIDRNTVIPGDIASVLFTGTPDITSAFPAEAARQLGWASVPLICFQEMNVSGALPLCIRILMLINTEKTQEEIRHVYLNGASVLREDLKLR